MTAPDAPRCPYCETTNLIVCDDHCGHTFHVWCMGVCKSVGPKRLTREEAIAAFCGKGEP